MLSRRTLDIIVTTSLIVVAALVALLGDAQVPVQLMGGLGAVLAFAVIYVTIGRPVSEMLGTNRTRYVVLLLVMSATLLVGTMFTPVAGFLQAVAYPLIWVAGSNRLQGIVGSIFIGVCVFIGTALGDATTSPDLGSAAVSSVIATLFSIGMGTWMWQFASYGVERDQLLVELTQAQDEVARLAKSKGISEERERFSRDVHDTLAQTLSALVMFSERAGRQADKGDIEAMRSSVATVEAVARDALADARAIVANSAPLPLEHAFTSAIERLVERSRALAQHTVQLQLDSGLEHVSRDNQVVVLRCLQESLSNVARHAHARAVHVQVSRPVGADIELLVRDDGLGFSPAQAHGFGIVGMRERVNLAQGTFDLRTASGSGTELIITLPSLLSEGTS